MKRLLLPALLASLLAPTDAAQASYIDLAAGADFTATGSSFGEVGRSVADAGDVNNDGVGDVIIGSPGSHAAYVVFGKPAGASANLTQLGASGFAITASGGDRLGAAVDGIGDMNDDGFDDVIVGEPGTSPNSPYVPRAHVVYGSASTATVDVDNLGTRGWSIVGRGQSMGFEGEQLGTYVAGLGDVNGEASRTSAPERSAAAIRASSRARSTSCSARRT